MDPNRANWPATDITVTPEYVGWCIGPFLLTLYDSGHTTVHLVGEVESRGNAKDTLSLHVAQSLAAAMSIMDAKRHKRVFDLAMGSVRKLCQDAGIDWADDPSVLKLDGLNGNAIATVAALLP